MEEKLLKLVSDVLDVPYEKLSLKSNVDDFENWDSLAQMNLVFAIEETFGVTLTDEQVFSVRSLKSLYEIINQ
jgi:acyl carrier protein